MSLFELWVPRASKKEATWWKTMPKQQANSNMFCSHFRRFHCFFICFYVCLLFSHFQMFYDILNVCPINMLFSFIFHPQWKPTSSTHTQKPAHFLLVKWSLVTQRNLKSTAQHWGLTGLPTCGVPNRVTGGRWQIEVSIVIGVPQKLDGFFDGKSEWNWNGWELGGTFILWNLQIGTTCSMWTSKNIGIRSDRNKHSQRTMVWATDSWPTLSNMKSCVFFIGRCCNPLQLGYIGQGCSNLWGNHGHIGLNCHIVGASRLSVDDNKP